MSEPLTRRDLDDQTDRLADRLTDYIRERFELSDRLADERHAGMTQRLDKLNGSVARHDREIAELKAIQPKPDTPRMPRTPWKGIGIMLASAAAALWGLFHK
jgi:transposase